MRALLKKNKAIYKFLLRIYSCYKKIENITVYYIYVCSRHSKELKKYQNRHLNKRCFIIGTGPSLNVDDLEKLKNEYTFASHRIYQIFNETEWRPTYYIAQDSALIKKISDEIKDINSEKFLPYNDVVKFKLKDANTSSFFLLKEPFYPNTPKFSTNISTGVYEGFTVTYAALQIAAYMGFKEIYLLGIDFNYSKSVDAKGNVVEKGNIKDYYSDHINNNGINLPNLDYSYLAYQAAKKFADEKDIKIYYVTRNGKLDVFEKLDFDKVINN